MKIYHRFLISCIVFFLCLIFFTPSLTVAQENLPIIVKRIRPSVVVILAYDKERKAIGQGSGFFINDKGHIITNRHVLEGANYAEVKTVDGRLYPVKKVLAENSGVDLIYISVDITKEWVHPLSISNFIPEVGERVVVIGNPLGLEQTVSDGIVSAIRDIPAIGKVIQITAPISPGSSGSPVVNMKGEVIGVATFQIGKGQNLNFAIPGEMAARLVPGAGEVLDSWEERRKREWTGSAEEAYSKGLSFLWTGDCNRAFPYFEEAIKRNSRYAEAYFHIGYCSDKFNQYNQAINAYKQAISIKPNFAEANNNLGYVYRNLGLYNEAIAAFKEAIRIRPNLADAHYNLGVTFFYLNRYEEAIEPLRQATYINPNYAQAYNVSGYVYLKLNRPSEAIEAFKHAIRVNPNYPEAYSALGAAYAVLE